MSTLVVDTLEDTGGVVSIAIADLFATSTLEDRLANDTDTLLGANLIGYNSSTVADELAALSSKAAGTIHASEFGLLGDGSDETVKVQNAFTAASAQKKTLVGDRGKTYKITSSITGASDCYVKDFNIDASAMTGTKHALVFAGVQQSAALLNFNVAPNATLIRLQAGGGDLFNVDEWAFLTVEVSSAYPGSSIARGEWVQVRSKSGDDITITTPLVQGYNTSNTAYLRKINMVSNVKLDNVRVTGSGLPAQQERGICFRYSRDFEVTNCHVTGIDYYAIEVSQSIRFNVNRNTVRNPFYDGATGMIFYGIALLNGCQYFNVGNNYGSRTRHLVVTTGATGGGGAWGQAMFGIIHDNILEDCMSGGAGRSYAYEVHGTGQHLTWATNIANGCYSFMRIEGGSDIQVIGGGCNGYAFQGLIIGGAGQTVRNIDIRGVSLNNYTAEVGGLAAAIRFETSTVMENVTIDGVKICGAAVTNVGNAVSIGTSTTCRNNHIKNIEASAGSAESTGAAVVTAASVTGFEFEDCVLFGWRQGYNFSTSTSKLVVRGGTVENFAAGGTGVGFYSNGARNICKDVHFRNINTAIRLDTASTNSLAVNNTMTDCTIPVPSNAGTANVVTPNYTV
jgi:hypothetical protein